MFHLNQFLAQFLAQNLTITVNLKLIMDKGQHQLLKMVHRAVNREKDLQLHLPVIKILASSLWDIPFQECYLSHLLMTMKYLNKLTKLRVKLKQAIKIKVTNSH